MQIKYDIDDYKEQFNAKETRHQSEKCSILSDCPEPAPVATETTEQRETSVVQIYCGMDGCKKKFANENSLNTHQLAKHAIPLRCLFSVACMNSNDKYLGMLDLTNHIVSQHVDSFTQRTCFLAECHSRKRAYEWRNLLQHMIERHTSYLLQ